MDEIQVQFFLPISAHESGIRSMFQGFSDKFMAEFVLSLASREKSLETLDNQKIAYSLSESWRYYCNAVIGTWRECIDHSSVTGLLLMPAIYAAQSKAIVETALSLYDAPYHTDIDTIFVYEQFHHVQEQSIDEIRQKAQAHLGGNFTILLPDDKEYLANYLTAFATSLALMVIDREKEQGRELQRPALAAAMALLMKRYREPLISSWDRLAQRQNWTEYAPVNEGVQLLITQQAKDLFHETYREYKNIQEQSDGRDSS